MIINVFNVINVNTKLLDRIYFGTAKGQHAMRYTQQRGKAKMEMKVGLTFACMNMKKLANILWYRMIHGQSSSAFNIISKLFGFRRLTFA